MRFNHKLSLVRVELSGYPDNEGAVRLYESFGFAREGVKRKCTRRRGAWLTR
jgi:RimJ/RimL family protein N-acetyltransferase